MTCDFGVLTVVVSTVLGALFGMLLTFFIGWLLYHDRG
jgi:membrane protein DedA with SNARE-associated domain